MVFIPNFGLFSSFPGKLAKPGGYLQLCLFFVESQETGAWRPPGRGHATSCSLWPPRTSWSRTWMPCPLPPFSLAALLFPPLSLIPALPLSRARSQYRSSNYQGRHLGSLFCTPCLSDESRRSMMPPSSSSPEESTRTARSHRRLAGFPHRFRACRRKNLPPSACFQPNQPRRIVPGEFSVQMGPFPASLVPRRRRR
jgi:hypothetical protein